MENEMKNNRVTAATLTIIKELANGKTIAFAKIELAYKDGSQPIFAHDVDAHRDRLFQNILQSKGVFKLLSGISLSYKKHSRLQGDIYYAGEHSQQLDSLPDTIGASWCNVITKGMGSYCKLSAESLHRRPIDEVIAQARVDSISATNKCR